MSHRIRHDVFCRELSGRRRLLTLLMGLLLLTLGMTYFDFLTGWSAGMGLESVSQPSVLVEASRAWFLVDEYGAVRGAISQGMLPGLPQLRGIDVRALLHQEFPAVEQARRGNEIAILLGENDDHQLGDSDVHVDFSNPWNIVVVRNGTTIHFGSSDVQQKWDRVIRVRDVRGIHLLTGHELDLRFPNTVIMRGP